MTEQESVMVKRTIDTLRAEVAELWKDNDRLAELNAKHVLNRIEIEGQFHDLRAVVEAARAVERDVRGMRASTCLCRECSSWTALSAALAALEKP